MLGGIHNLVDRAPNPPPRGEPADQLWRISLQRISTRFGRLVYLSSLRAESGTYRESSLAGLLGPEGADRAIQHSHYENFSKWLTLSLAEQKSDLDEYLREQGYVAGQPIQWSILLPYRALIPPSAREVERQLYLADLETLLELLKSEHAAAFSSRES